VIAASAATDGAILITRNLKDFEKVKHIVQIQKPY
jgi:predicted nucleic acid-binding protein